MSKKDRIRNIFDIILGVLFISTTISGYYKDISYMSEYCFISGIIVGLIFIGSFIFYIRKRKHFPEWIYADCVVTIMVILIATLIIKLSLEGAFWFIHVINPILLFVYWCIFCNHNKINNPLLISTNLVFPLFYIIFAKVIFTMTNKCPFPAKLILVGNPWHVVICYIIGICFVFLLLGYGLHFGNRLINQKVRR